MNMEKYSDMRAPGSCSNPRGGLTVRIDADCIESDSDSSITQVTQLSPGEQNMSFPETEPEVRHQLPTFDSATWYRHPCFRRYWDHYNSMISWCQKHYQLMSNYNKAPVPFTFPRFPYPMENPSQRSTQGSKIRQLNREGIGGRLQNHQHPNTAPSPYQSRKKPVSRKRDKLKRQTEKEVITEEVSSADSEMSLSSNEAVTASDIELTKEMIQFFSHTIEHRKQRDEKKKEEKQMAKEDILINIENVNRQQKPGTSEAPKQRPGSQRTAQMKVLYGKGAAMIHGMETALQMTFDRNMDIKQPKHWPNMPLKIVFN